MKTAIFPKQPELFIAVEVTEPDQQILQSLTTEVMCWSDSVWLMDLTRFYEYWQQQAITRKTAPLTLWRKLLNHLLGEEPVENNSKIISLSPSYRGSCAKNPWSALLLLRAMKDRQVKGLLSLQSSFGQSLFREISWESWWQEIEVIESHFQGSRLKGFKQAGFRQQCKRLKQAVPRLDFKKPWEMRILHRTGVKNRFGEVLENLWNWSYGEETQTAPNVYQSQFPWKAWLFESPPVVTRHTDYPLTLWDQFAPLLSEDFDRLCRSLKNSGARVTRIDWILKLEEMNDLEVPILFRNPHDLQEERGAHTTALLQANYGFISALEKCAPRESSGNQSGIEDSMPLVLGWQLKLTERLYLPDVVLDIFGQSQERDGDLEILLRLENELPVKLVRFAACGDWFPEDSFREEHFEEDCVEGATGELGRSLHFLAEERPLFVRQSPLPVAGAEKGIRQQFLESTMTKWWRSELSQAKGRNYFRQIDSDGNAFWVFQDGDGQWYQHGVFG